MNTMANLVFAAAFAQEMRKAADASGGCRLPLENRIRGAMHVAAEIVRYYEYGLEQQKAEKP